MNKFTIYNTLNKSKEEFSPIDVNNVRIYTCGPTVYNYAHIGNARPAVVSDLLVRLLRHLYPKVTYVSNITDIDDKIIKSSQEKKMPIETITKKYEKIYNEDMQSLNVLPPDIQPHATDHIEDMIDLIEKNIKNEKAYVADGHVLFNVDTYKAYGMLSGRDKDDQIAGSRVKVADYKKKPGDFVLWKPSVDDQPGWNSPWGFGRPGWHLECSAMSEKSLGLPFDIHGGGMDLIFPHHENEIAQSCGAYNENENPRKYVKYWLHNALLNMDGEKMSKSLGNILYIRDLLKKYDGEVLRLALLSGHYRQPLNFTEDTLNQSKSNLKRLYRSLDLVGDIEIDKKNISPPDEVISPLCNDLNTSEAFAAINEIAKRIISSADEEEKKQLKIKLISSCKIFGILQKNPKIWLDKDKIEGDFDIKLIEKLINDRHLSRLDKDFDKADRIREELSNLGVDIEDTSDGTIWKAKIK
jgi:cysteinyl-tRNA synthetase